MRGEDVFMALGLGGVLVGYWGARRLGRFVRKLRYQRGTRLKSEKPKLPRGEVLAWGNGYVSAALATSHFLVVGTTGSGKSLLQRRLMAQPLRAIAAGSDQRAVIFDAKQDVAAYLQQIGVTAPVLSLNPFHTSSDHVTAVAWDIARDITSPARAQNLASSLVPAEKGGANRYFTDAARQVVAGVVESFIRHAGKCWTFADLVHTCLSQERIAAVLARDADGRDVLAGFFGDARTAYQVFSTVCSKLAYYKPVAALWQRTSATLSVREWLESSSILLLGANATAKSTLEAINAQVFRILVEEIDVQPNSQTRRTWVWLDEARLAGPLLQSDLLPFLAVKGRSKGAALVLAFQDVEGLKEAAGERIANEIIAQCSHIALLRQASAESAKWASSVLGQQETLEAFYSENITGMSRSISEQRVQKDAVLAAEFCRLPVTNRVNGLTGYFVAPEWGAWKGTIRGDELQRIIVTEQQEWRAAPTVRPEADQWLRPWTRSDEERLALDVNHEIELERRTDKALAAVTANGKTRVPSRLPRPVIRWD